MKKHETERLKRDLYRASLGVCPVHKLPLKHHMDASSELANDREGCWDCPISGCPHHMHEPPYPDGPEDANFRKNGYNRDIDYPED